MSYRAFRSTDQQAAAETQFPDRFDDGAAWRAIAERAAGAGDVTQYDPVRWEQLTGQRVAQTEPITASRMWELRDDYETARLGARYVTLAGLETLRALRDSLALELRGSINPVLIRGGRGGLYVIEQAGNDPDRRRTFSQLIRDLGLTRATIYTKQPQQPPAPRDVGAGGARKPGPAQCAAIVAKTSRDVRYQVANNIIPHNTPEIEVMAIIEQRVMAQGCALPPPPIRGAIRVVTRF